MLSDRKFVELNEPSFQCRQSTCEPFGEIAWNPDDAFVLKSEAPVAVSNVPQGLYPPWNEATSRVPSFETLWQATQPTPGGGVRNASGPRSPGLIRTTLPVLTSQ